GRRDRCGQCGCPLPDRAANEEWWRSRRGEPEESGSVGCNRVRSGCWRVLEAIPTRETGVPRAADANPELNGEVAMQSTIRTSAFTFRQLAIVAAGALLVL